MKKMLLISLLFSGFAAMSQNEIAPKKKAVAVRSEERLTIDGVLNEAQWMKAQVLTDFIQRDPNPGAPSSLVTEVKVLYDDDAIYIGAFMKDPAPDSILKELTQRDEVGNADWFIVVIDAYKDGNNGVGFLLTASGIQNDIKYSFAGEDESWNAVWQSAVKITKEGWFAEYRIPYSALRFPEVPVQSWNINFLRNIRRSREGSSWNIIDPKINGFLNQSGTLEGIEGIKPPLRLQLFPYISTYRNYFEGKGKTLVNGGMDIKYGLNDAFTLDMTLIPDFGQVQSDNQVLNLSPFEVRFQENRQFFTEGLELFNKADLFYSRRIGTTSNFASLAPGDQLAQANSETKLLNATKISGRTSKGTGVGFLNALSAENRVDVINSEGVRRAEVYEPLTNYNVFVVDQNLANNSYVTLINTNVLRNGKYYDANVTGTQFYLQNKSLKYALWGTGAVSQKLYEISPNDVGIRHGLNFGKVSGNFTAQGGYDLKDNKFDPNDLGFLLFNNTIDIYANASYNLFKPFGKFNRAGFSFNAIHSSLYKPNKFNNFGLSANAFFILKSFHAFGGFLALEPIRTFDYFEPRTGDYSAFYSFPVNYTASGWISTDYRKRFAFDLNLGYRKFNENGRNNVDISISPRFRANDHLSFVYTISNQSSANDVGYAVLNSNGFNALFGGTLGLPENQIIFGIRDRNTVSNVLSFKYTLNNRSGLTFRLRHYWSKVKYDELKSLDQNGNLASTEYAGRSVAGLSYHDNSFNAFNIDMVYSWVFAPGSELRFVWKNSVFSSEDNVNRNYSNNLQYVFDQSQLNSFSMKFLYFLDYSSLKFKRNAKDKD